MDLNECHRELNHSESSPNENQYAVVVKTFKVTPKLSFNVDSVTRAFFPTIYHRMSVAIHEKQSLSSKLILGKNILNFFNFKITQFLTGHNGIFSIYTKRFHLDPKEQQTDDNILCKHCKSNVHNDSVFHRIYFCPKFDTVRNKAI